MIHTDGIRTIAHYGPIPEARPKTKPGDLRVENHGSVFLVRGRTPRGEEWLHEHTADDAQWFGGALAVERRYIEPIVDGAIGDGLHVQLAA